MSTVIEHRLTSIEKIVKSMAGKGSHQLQPVWLDCQQFCAKEGKDPRQFQTLRNHPDYKKCFGKRTAGSKTFYYINYPKYLELQNSLIVPIAD